jgi:hypothetical protein
MFAGGQREQPQMRLAILSRKKIAQKKWPTLKNNYLVSWQVIWSF